MKPTLALCFLTSTIVLCAPEAQAKSRAKRAVPVASKVAKGHATVKLSRSAAPSPALELGDLKDPKESKEPKHSHSHSSFWLAANPHVPLAIVHGKEIRSVGKRGKDCGEADRWARPKSGWRAVDAWGQFTGTFEVAHTEFYDVTRCEELSLVPRVGKRGVGLFVSRDSNYKPHEPVAYEPTAGETERFDHFLSTVETAWLNGRPFGKPVPFAKRTMFFQFPLPKEVAAQRIDGTGTPLHQPRFWAVAGGPILVVAYLGEHGHWKAATVKRPLGLTDSYSPEAVFDMNNDGVPEIVYQSSDGPGFADNVLALNPAAMTWEDAAESVGGAAL